MRRVLGLIAAEAVKYWAEIKSYLFNTLSWLVALYIIFLTFFLGLRHFAGPSVDGMKLDSIIVGYVTWMFALMGFQGISYGVVEETHKGTFEQLYLSPLGLETIFAVRILYEFLYSLVFNSAILLLTMVTTGRWLSLGLPGFLKLFLLLTLSLPSLWGLGYLFGGLAMLSKKMGAFLQVISFLLIGLVALPGYPFKPVSLLPFTAGASSLRALVCSSGSQTFPLLWYLFLLALSSFYILIGLWLYRLCERVARRRNLLGQY